MFHLHNLGNQQIQITCAQLCHRTLNRQAGIVPFYDTASVIMDVCVSERIDRTGRFDAAISAISSSVEDYESIFVFGQADASGSIGDA